MHFASHLQSAAAILRLYDGSVPFAAWLKNYFREHKKFGSRDRRLVSDLCFCYFRLGKAFDEVPLDERLLIGQFLCKTENVLLGEVKPEWVPALAEPVNEKLQLLGGSGEKHFFPWPEEISPEIDAAAFNISHLVQPDLFLRVRLGKNDVVRRKLQNAALAFSEEGDCFRLANASKVDEVIDLDADAVVQDKSSQRVLDLVPSQIQNSKFKIGAAWDCCAASGGKSIMLHDRFPNVRLAVSDVRESILHNLRSRFKRAGVTSYQSFVADVAKPGFTINRSFDAVICDAPCSGSGTWGRTPEQLRFFPREKIAHYTSLQKSIALNASKALKSGGVFLYVTCSVFKKENEDVVEFLAQNTAMKLVDQRYLKGYTEKADTLFAALFSL